MFSLYIYEGEPMGDWIWNLSHDETEEQLHTNRSNWSRSREQCPIYPQARHFDTYQGNGDMIVSALIVFTS